MLLAFHALFRACGSLLKSVHTLKKAKREGEKERKLYLRKKCFLKKQKYTKQQQKAS